MAFGVSGNDKKSQMIGGDVTVAWMDHSTGTHRGLFQLFYDLHIFDRYFAPDIPPPQQS